MTFFDFLLGIPLVVALLAVPVLGARSFRQQLIPHSRGIDAGLIDVVMVLSIVTIVSQVLGALGWFALPWVIVGANGLGAVVHLAVRRLATRTVADEGAGDCRGTTDDRRSGRRIDHNKGDAPWGRPTLAVAVGAVLVVLGSWLARTLSAMDHGMTTADSLWYHLPYAVRYVQTGRMTALVPMDSDSVTAYFPGTSSIYHALLYLVFHSDIVSVVVNLGWFGLLLLAAWNIGERFRVGVPALLCGALVLGTPLMIDTQPGGALTDVVGLALLLVAVAIALHAEPRAHTIWRWVPIGFALGLSTGMKFTFIVPAGLIALSLALAGGSSVPRVRRLLAVVTAAALTGGFWYLRNLILVGNPLPPLDARIGPLRLRGIPGNLPQSSVSDLLFSGRAWSDHLLPGLHDAFGPVWPLVLMAMLGGPVAALLRGREPVVRVLGAASLAMSAVFIWSPQYLFGGIFFATNLRYALPGLLLGIVIMPIPFRDHRRVLVWVLAVVIFATQGAPAAWGLGSGGFFSEPTSRAALVAALGTVGLGILVSATRSVWTRIPGPKRRPALIATLCSVVVGLAFLNVGFQRDRYRSAEPFPAAYEFIRDAHDVRIGVHGQLMMLKYGFAGADWSNDVRYLVVEETDGAVRSAQSCPEWVDGLRQGAFELVILSVPTGGDQFSEWTRGIPGARLLNRSPIPNVSVSGIELPPQVVEIYHLPPGPSDSHC